MTRRNIETLNHVALNWAVAKLEGKTKFGIKAIEVNPTRLILWANAEHTEEFVADYASNIELTWPILMRERIMFWPDMSSRGIWNVAIGNTEDDDGHADYTTDLLGGALACYVIHTNGKTMDIPKEVLASDADWFTI